MGSQYYFKFLLFFLITSIKSSYVIAEKINIEIFLNKKINKVYEDGSREYKIIGAIDGLSLIIIRHNGIQEQHFEDRIEYYYRNNGKGVSFKD